MGVKGLWWWWGSDFISTGLTACDPTTNSNVWPSGAARATVLEPITPLAPVRLSTTTDWPHSSDRRCAIRRPTMSVPPPAEYGTTSVTALLRSDHAVGAGAVVDHHRLAPQLRQALRHQATDDVGAAAGRIRHHERDGLA